MKKIFVGLFCLVFCSLLNAQDFELLWKNGHQSELKTTSFSPNGKYFVSVEEDNVAIIWDIATEQQIKVLKEVRAASFTSNESILIVNEDKSCKTVDLSGKTLIQYSTIKYQSEKKFPRKDRNLMHESGIYIEGNNIFDVYKGYLQNVWEKEAAYSIKEKIVARMDSKSGLITFYDLYTNAEKGKVQSGNTTQKEMEMEFSLDGKTLLVYTNSQAQTVDVASFKILNTIQRSKITRAQINSSGTVLAIWNENMGKSLVEFELYNTKTNTVLFSQSNTLFGDIQIQVLFQPDGEAAILQTRNSLKSIALFSLFDLKSGAKKWTYTMNNYSHLKDFVFSENEQKLVLYAQCSILKKDSKGNIIDSKGFDCIAELNVATGFENWIQNFDDMGLNAQKTLKYSPDQKKICYGHENQIRILNTATGKLENTLKGNSTGGVYGIEFATNQNELFGFQDKTVFSWNLLTGEMNKKFLLNLNKNTTKVGQYAFGKNWDKTYIIQDVKLTELDANGKTTFVFPNTNNLNYRFNTQTSFDGKYIMSQGNPKIALCTNKNKSSVVEIYEANTHKLIYSNLCVYGHVSFGGSSNIIAIQEVTNENAIKFIDLSSSKALFEVNVPKEIVLGGTIVFSQDNQFVTLNGSEKEGGNSVGIIVDLQTKMIKTFKVTHPEAVYKSDRNSKLNIIGFTPDNKYIVYDSYRTNKILFYDVTMNRFNESMTYTYPENINALSSIILSPNGKLLIIGTYNGTILLWDIASKKYQGTLYPDVEKGNWAVINSQGMFDGNESALNKMFFVSGNNVLSLGAVFEKFYTPKLLPRILSGEKFSPTPVDVNKLKKAPTVKIDFKENNRNLTVEDDDTIETIQSKSANATLTINAECPQDAVTEIRLYHNGKLLGTSRNLTVEDDENGSKKLTKTYQVSLLKNNNEFKAIALNTEKTESKPVLLKINYTPEKVETEKVATDEVVLHLVVVGINVYKNPKYNLNYAKVDADAFTSAIQLGSKSIFNKIITYSLQDLEAGKAGIISALEQVKSNANPQDVLLFYFAGHGVLNDKNEFYIVPSDVTQLYGNDQALAQNGLSAAEMQLFSKNIKAQKQLFILDACQSAGALDNLVASRGAIEEKAIAQMARATGTHWLTASGSTQFASEFSQIGHGSFTYCLLEAFKGEADNGDKKLTVKELDAYLQIKVPEITQKYKGSPQYPASYGYGNDFPIVIIKN
jgi:WD40 repeat protein